MLRSSPRDKPRDGRPATSGIRSRIGALSPVAHDDVVVPVDLAVLALALIVIVTLRTKRQFHVTPVVSNT